jgi:hypothetical protein
MKKYLVIAVCVLVSNIYSQQNSMSFNYEPIFPISNERVDIVPISFSFSFQKNLKNNLSYQIKPGIVIESKDYSGPELTFSLAKNFADTSFHLFCELNLHANLFSFETGKPNRTFLFLYGLGAGFSLSSSLGLEVHLMKFFTDALSSNIFLLKMGLILKI